MDENERKRLTNFAEHIEQLVAQMSEYQKGYILGVAEMLAASRPEPPKKTA